MVFTPPSISTSFLQRSSKASPTTDGARLWQSGLEPTTRPSVVPLNQALENGRFGDDRARPQKIRHILAELAQLPGVRGRMKGGFDEEGRTASCHRPGCMLRLGV